jgi:HNH endonuclease
MDGLLMYNEQISLSKLKSILKYDPITGLFTWRVKRRCGRGKFTRIGGIAGFKESLGYWCIGIEGKTYKCHRLAWLFCYGKWPRDDIDHINGNRMDNRIANLRIGGKQLNPRNAKRKSSNKSGFKGVHKDKGGYIARICVNYNRIYLGHFRTARAAHAAYALAAQRYYGEFARIV